MDAQKLFDHYNQKYFAGKLSRYTVEISNKYQGGRCVKGKRIIYLNVELAEMKTALLHEMAHAKARNGHGPIWRREMARLRKLGAPIPKKEYESCARRDRTITRRDILVEIRDKAGEAINVPVSQLVYNICYQYGITTNADVAETARDRRFLQEALRAATEARAEAEKWERESEANR